MTKKIEYKQKSAFINRKKELHFLADWIDNEPNEILFIYGPKSSGKTTLLMKFIDLYTNDNHYNIKHFNLRKVLIANYIDFIQSFFEVDYSKSSSEKKQRSEYSLKVFKLSKEIKKSLENKVLDPFAVMEQELIKIAKKKRPVIIIDELQALEDIYINGQRELLKELFNFFVAMTKESHLCHVIIASSDGYFLNRLYEDSKLSKTSIYFQVDYLSEQDTRYWLNHLASESNIKDYQLNDSQIDQIWKYFGGSMWEISSLLRELVRCSKNYAVSDAHIKSKIDHKIEENCGRFEHYAGFRKNRKALLKQIYSCCERDNCFKPRDMEPMIQKNIFDEDALSDELNRLVQFNYLAFDPTRSTYQLHGNSMLYGLQKYINSL